MANNRILIIDDDMDILETMEALLSNEGYQIRSADTVEAGIGMIENYSPGVILLDIMFPEKKTRGFEAAAEIKQKFPRIPIFVITAINREYAFDFAKNDINADEFINKPVDYDRLLALLRQHVNP